jgi:hypothetical protein
MYNPYQLPVLVGWLLRMRANWALFASRRVFFDIGEDGRTQTPWHVKCPGLSSAFFFCIVLVVSVPKNTNLLGWYLTSRIGCLVEVLNCWTFNLYVYRYTDTYKYMYIYIHIVCIYVYTHYIHILLMYRKERIFFDFCRNICNASAPIHSAHPKIDQFHLLRTWLLGRVGDLFLDPRLGQFH